MLNEGNRPDDLTVAGDMFAASELLPQVYDELRKLAAALMFDENASHTLNGTALVHEAYLRLINHQRFEGRRHFYVAAAQAMRRILIDHARAKNASKRGGSVERSAVDPDCLSMPELDVSQLLDLDELLTRFEAIDPDAGGLAKLVLFGGLSVEESAEALGIPRASAFRKWSYARAWLGSRLSGGREECKQM